MPGSRRKPVETIWVYRDERGAIRYRGYDEEGNLISNPRTSFMNRMTASEILRERHPRARIVFSKPKHIIE